MFCDDFGDSLFHSLILCRKADEYWKELATRIGLVNYKAFDFKEIFGFRVLFLNQRRLEEEMQDVFGWLSFGVFGYLGTISSSRTFSGTLKMLFGIARC